MAVNHANHGLVPVSGGSVATTSPGLAVEGMESLDQSDLVLPRWSIIQPTSQKPGAEEHPGQFVRNIDGEFRPYVDAVILQVNKTRLLWSGDLSDNRPECLSRDGAQGSVYGPCTECEFNIEVNPDLAAERAANPKSSLKICGRGYTYIIVDDPEAETIALLGAMGTSVRPARVLNTQFVQRRRPPFTAVVRFETEMTRNDRGKFYVLKPRIVKWLEPERAQAMRELYLSLKGMAIKDIDDDAEPEASDGPGQQGDLPF